MSNEGVAIQIGYYPGDELVKPNSKGGYYYESDGGGRVSITVEDYPIKYGPYLKLTHSVEDGNIGSITHNSVLQTGITDLGTQKNVSVYYWSGDETFDKPLIIQLGSGSDYYIISDNGNDWSASKEINEGTLRERLNKQNCGKNEAHIVKITEKSAYTCPSCSNRTRIKVSPNSMSTYIHSTHSIGYSQPISVATFRDNKNDHIGLPSLKDVDTVHVYFNSKVGGTPVLIHYQKSGEHWYMRNTKDSHTWSEVPRDERPKDPDDDSDNKIKKLLGKGSYHPEITLDLSNPGNYSDESTGISITVRATSVYGGYSKFEHSLRGGLFKVTQVKHGQGTTLNGVFSPETFDGVTAFYFGTDPTEVPNFLLIELRSSGGTKYEYYYRDKKDAPTWSLYTGPEGGTTRLKDNSLKTELERLKKIHFPDPGLSGGEIAAISVPTVLTGGGLIGVVAWKWPSIMSFLITNAV